jgi:hypothetical protein
MKSTKLVGILVASLMVASNTFAQRAIEMSKEAVGAKEIEAAKSAVKGFIPEGKSAEAEKAIDAAIAKKGGNLSSEDVIQIAKETAAKISGANGQTVALEKFKRMEDVISKAVSGSTEATNNKEALAFLGSESGVKTSCSLKRTATAFNPENVAARGAFEEVQGASSALEANYTSLGISTEVDRGSLLSWAAEGSDVGKGAVVMVKTLNKAAEEAASKGLKGKEAQSYIRAAGLKLVADSMGKTAEAEEVKEFGEVCGPTFGI